MTHYIFLITVLAVLAIAVVFVTLRGIKLTNEQYDRLKDIVIKWPGIVTFLGVLVSTFHFEYGNETITVVSAFGAFLAYMLGISDKQYTEGAYIDDLEGGINEDDDF